MGQVLNIQLGKDFGINFRSKGGKIPLPLKGLVEIIEILWLVLIPSPGPLPCLELVQKKFGGGGGGDGGCWRCFKTILIFCFGPNIKLWF